MKLDVAKIRVEDLVDRWDKTEVWHEPEFLNGTIKITTADLLAIKLVMEDLKGK